MCFDFDLLFDSDHGCVSGRLSGDTLWLFWPFLDSATFTCSGIFTFMVTSYAYFMISWLFYSIFVVDFDESIT